MIDYIFSARTKSGKMKRGEITADSLETAAELLIEKSLIPITISIKSQSAIASLVGKLNEMRPISMKEKVIFSRQLSTLLNAGLPITQCFENLKEGVTNPKFLKIIDSILQDIDAGETLASAMAKYPTVFDAVYMNLIRAGEISGNLDQTLEKLADQKEKEAEIVSKIRGALIYPAIVLLICFGVVIMLITTVVPQVVVFYQDLKRPTPKITQFLLNISDFFQHRFYYIPIALAVFFVAMSFLKKIKAVRVFLDVLKIRTPLIGPIVKKMYMARFSGVLSSLVSSGISLNEALDITARAINNSVIEKEIEGFIKIVESGGALAGPIKESKEFLPLVGQMVGIGEKTGEVDAMLNRITLYYDQEISRSVKNITTIIEPVMMVLMGGMVGFILAAVMVPMYGLINELNK